MQSILTKSTVLHVMVAGKYIRVFSMIINIWIIIKIISGFGRLFSKVLEKVIGVYSSFCTFMQVFFHDLFLKSIRLLWCFQVTLSIL